MLIPTLHFLPNEQQQKILIHINNYTIMMDMDPILFPQIFFIKNRALIVTLKTNIMEDHLYYCLHRMDPVFHWNFLDCKLDLSGISMLAGAQHCQLILCMIYIDCMNCSCHTLLSHQESWSGLQHFIDAILITQAVCGCNRNRNNFKKHKLGYVECTYFQTELI